MSINEAKWTFFLSLCASRITSYLFLTGIVSRFFHPLSTAAFAFGILIACGIGINLCTTWQCVIEVNPSAAMWSSWFLDCRNSARCLVDSRDSTVQPHIVLHSFSLPIFGFAFAFTMLGCGLSRLWSQISSTAHPSVRGAPRSDHLSIRPWAFWHQCARHCERGLPSWRTLPLPASTFSALTITGGYARAVRVKPSPLPLRRPDCTLGRLLALPPEQHDRPVTQSIATQEPGWSGPNP